MDGLGTLNPREQVEERLAALERQIGKAEAEYESADTEEERVGIAQRLGSLRQQRAAWVGWMRNHGHKWPGGEAA